LEQRLQVRGSGDELDRLAGTLNDMLDRLNDAFRQIRQFSADASHELQTPLTILKGEMEVALRARRSPEEYQRVLRSGLEEIDRINHLVAGLLLLARADAGMLRMDTKPVDVGELMQGVCEQMKTRADARAVRLHLELQEPVTVEGDREHLRRLLLNLVDNAVKYTPEGGRVSLSYRLDTDGVRLRVSDTGVGISGEGQPLIFRRFHRAAETRSQDETGVGLGLSIARSIAEAHGGSIDVESAPGQGSTFTVNLPASLSPPLPTGKRNE
jgi:heavy metal sensor kinase